MKPILLLAGVVAMTLSGAQRQVSITIDDLPLGGGDLGRASWRGSRR